MTYALYRHDMRVSKPYSTRESALINAAVEWSVPWDYSEHHGYSLAQGYSIREVKDD